MTAEHEAAAKEVIGYTRRRPKAEATDTRLPEDIETITEELIPCGGVGGAGRV